MSRFKSKGKKELPAISTASLPDIIFILLFFFMVVTVIREVEIKVKQQMPRATEIQKLERKELVSYIYIGEPTADWAQTLGDAPRVQLNDVFATPDDVQQFIENEREKRDPRLRPAMTWSLKVDKETTMGIVSDVKQEMRKGQALKLNYSTFQRDEIY